MRAVVMLGGKLVVIRKAGNVSQAEEQAGWQRGSLSGVCGGGGGENCMSG